MMPSSMRVVDSHTEGEPTRVIVDGWPQPAGDTMEARRESLRRDADALRSAVVCEPVMSGPVRTTRRATAR